jgi:hypothetical protein
MGTLPVEAARWREVFDFCAKSGLLRRVGCRRIRRATRTGSLSWIARRRRVEGSILGWEVRGLFREILGSGESYIVAAW